jgi:hypothetical protein
MTTRGRPAKVLTLDDIHVLEKFLEQLPYQKKNQQTVLKLIKESKGVFDDKQLSLLKIVDREKNQFQQRQTLIEQIKIKHKNQQKLLANEIEILGLIDQEQDRDTFFRLDRVLDSYQKIEKAALEDRIRLENEQRRELLQKSCKQLTEAQKKRNTENQLKYTLGGAVLAAWKKLGASTEDIDPKKIENQIVNRFKLVSKIQKTRIFQEAYELTGDTFKARKLMLEALDTLPTYKMNNEELHKILLKKLYKPD